MTTGTPGSTARKNTSQQVNYLRFTVNWNDTAFNKQWLPAGAQILRTTVNVITAFTAGATLSAGVEVTTFADLVTSTQVGPATVGMKTAVAPTGIALVPLAADSQVFALLAGTAATVGQAVFVVEYIPNNDL
jgi:hypothetical protein